MRYVHRQGGWLNGATKIGPKVENHQDHPVDSNTIDGVTPAGENLSVPMCGGTWLAVAARRRDSRLPGLRLHGFVAARATRGPGPAAGRSRS